MNRGKLVILFIFGLSAAMGTYAWWHHFQQGQRCLELWGSRTAALIRYAPKVEAMVLGRGEADAIETISLGDRKLSVSQKRGIAGTPGLVHARQALIEDASFAWNRNVPEVPRDWNYALRFTDGEEQVTLALDNEHNCVRAIGQQGEGVLLPERMEAYQTRIPQWIKAAEGGSTR